VQPGPILGGHPHPLHPLSVVPTAKPPLVLGQKWCKATATLLWFSSTSVTPEGHPERGLGLPAARSHGRDGVCSRRGWIASRGERGPGRPLRRAGFTSVIWVTDKVTLGPCRCVTTGFLRSSAASAAAGFRILPSGAELESLSPSVHGTHSAPLAPSTGTPHGTPGWLSCPPRVGHAGQAPRACSLEFGFPFNQVGWPGGSSFNTKSCYFLN